MAEFMVNTDMFGMYVRIPTGYSREMHIYKVVSKFKTNSYCDVPRARGTHLLEPMKAIVKKLMDEGKSVKEISKQLGMKPEEIFRLSDFSKDDFLNMMVKHNEYSKAEILTKV